MYKAIILSTILVTTPSIAEDQLTINGCVIEPFAQCPNADLSGADLSNIDLSGADLSRANLTGADLRHSLLKNTNLEKPT